MIQNLEPTSKIIMLEVFFLFHYNFYKVFQSIAHENSGGSLEALRYFKIKV